jgi:hypothetical protein
LCCWSVFLPLHFSKKLDHSKYVSLIRLCIYWGPLLHVKQVNRAREIQCWTSQQRWGGLQKSQNQISSPRSNVGPKPFCWAKPTCFDFSSSNFDLHLHLQIMMGGVALNACHQRPLFGPLPVVVGPLQSKLWGLY